ncbi:hypothetical protein A2U01_0042907, partial [Trifolium medium]|nr:hypothetical protein [Trifolium medium]
MYYNQENANPIVMLNNYICKLDHLLRFAFKLDEAEKIGGVAITGATRRKAWRKAPSRDALLLFVLELAQGAAWPARRA